MAWGHVKGIKHIKVSCVDRKIGSQSRQMEKLFCPSIVLCSSTLYVEILQTQSVHFCLQSMPPLVHISFLLKQQQCCGPRWYWLLATSATKKCRCGRPPTNCQEIRIKSLVGFSLIALREVRIMPENQRCGRCSAIYRDNSKLPACYFRTASDLSFAIDKKPGSQPLRQILVMTIHEQEP